MRGIWIHRILLLPLLAIMLLVGGCDLEEWLEEDAFGEDTVQDQQVDSSKDRPKEADLAAFGPQEVCLESEESIDDEGICALPLVCNNVADCAAWGDAIASELTEQYGDFLLVEFGDETEDEDIDDEAEETPEEVLELYEINDREQMSDVHRQMWDDFRWLVPAAYTDQVEYLEIFAHDDTMAYVSPTDLDWEKWVLGLNEIPLSRNEQLGTYIHEMGHMLFLNTEQLDYEGDVDTCDTLFTEDFGCSYEDAYQYAYYEQFWRELEGWDEEDYAYEWDWFVSDYASSDIDEDMAESWVGFVTMERPEGHTLAEEKILFFYEYEELIMLRAELLSRSATWLQRQ